MELSVRDAKARFSEVAEAASRGERVVVTRHGKPFVELVPAKERGGVDFEKLDAYRRKMGWENVEINLPDYFDDPAFSRKVLGIDD
jgi:prevent-host-death family protein